MRRGFRGLSALAVWTCCFVGCGNPRPPQPPALELPRPVNDLRAVRKADKVFLTWTVPTRTTEAQTIRYLGPTRICRTSQSSIKDCGNPVGMAPAPDLSLLLAANRQGKVQTATYVDTLPAAGAGANANFTYAVEVLNENQRSAGLSNQVIVSAVPTLAAPSGFKASLTPDGINLTWQAVEASPDTPVLRHVFRIYRKAQDGPDVVIANLPMGTTQFLDHTFDWEKKYQYRATVASIVYGQESQNCPAGQQDTEGCVQTASVEGDDTPSVEIFAHDTLPPAVPSGLQAVYTDEGQQKFIDLIWSPNSEGDLAGYNVYRQEEGGAPAQINSELVKTPAYRDMSVQAGKKYFYSVSALDVRGNQSARSGEASETVP